MFILVGNFWQREDRRFLNGFQAKSFIGFVRNPDNSILTIDGLWSFDFR